MRSHDDETAMARTGESPLTQMAPSRRVDPSARMQVYFQGFLDASCFLYAQANAYKALTGNRVTREHWNRAISRLPIQRGSSADPAQQISAMTRPRSSSETSSEHSVTRERPSRSTNSARLPGSRTSAAQSRPTALSCSPTEAPASFSILRATLCAALRRATTGRSCISRARQRSRAGTCSAASTSSVITRISAVGPTTRFRPIAKWWSRRTSDGESRLQNGLVERRTADLLAVSGGSAH